MSEGSVCQCWPQGLWADMHWWCPSPTPRIEMTQVPDFHHCSPAWCWRGEVMELWFLETNIGHRLSLFYVWRWISQLTCLHFLTNVVVNNSDFCNPSVASNVANSFCQWQDFLDNTATLLLHDAYQGRIVFDDPRDEVSRSRRCSWQSGAGWH